MGHLAAEGLAGRAAVLVGDVMTDVLPPRPRRGAPTGPPSPARAGVDPERPYLRRHHPPGREHRRPGAAGAPSSAALAAARRAGRAARPPPAGRPARASSASTSTAGDAAHGRARCPTREMVRAVDARPAGSSPTPAACRRRRSCSACRAPRCAPRPSGPRPSSTAGTSWPSADRIVPGGDRPAPQPTARRRTGDGTGGRRRGERTRRQASRLLSHARTGPALVVRSSLRAL